MGDRDIFVAKYDSTGTLLWLASAGGKEYDNTMDLQLDDQSNVYIAGNFTDTSYFFGQQIVSELYIDNFIAKFSSEGEFLWVKHIPAETRANNLFINTFDEGFFYSGSFYDNIVFGTDTLVADGETDIFIAKFNEQGEYQNSFTFGGISTDRLRAMELKDANLYITAEFEEEITLQDTTFYSFGNTDLFTAKLDFSGNLLWTTHQAGFYVDKAKSLDLDNSGNVFITGEFDDIIYFGTDSLITNGVNDIFVAKYDNSGVYQWSEHIGNAFNEYANTILAGQTGEIYVSGTFKGEMSDGNHTISTVDYDYATDMFIAKFSNQGVLQWLSQSGGKNTDYANRIVSDPNNYLYIIGGFGENFAFEIDTLNTDSIIDANEDDIFIARFFDCDNADVLINGNDTAFCGHGQLKANNGFKKYEWNTGRRNKLIQISQSGDYWVTAIDRHNCSVQSDTVSVVVNPVPDPDLGNDINVEQGQFVQLTGGTFTTYLWNTAETDTLATTETAIVSTEEMEGTNTVYLTVTNELNCPGNDEIMLFVATPSYANNNENFQNQAVYQNVNEDYFSEELNPNVTIVQNTNTDTQNSELKTQSISINADEISETGSTMCYPNPSKGSFTVSLTNIELEPNSLLEIFTTDGKLVYKRNNVETRTINITLTSKGVHYVKITSGDKIYSEEIVIY